MKPYMTHTDGSVEWQCNECCEPILLFPKDAVTVVVGDGGIVEGVLCEPCAKMKQSGEDATDDR